MIEQITQFVTEQLSKNDLLAGGAMLGVMAYILNYLKSVPFTLMHWSRLLFVTQMDIPDRSETFKWISDWLSENKYTAKAKRITVETKGSNAKLTPSPGRHLVWWGWRPIILNRVRRNGTGDNAHRAFREEWVLTMLGKRAGVEKFIEECRKTFRREVDSNIDVYTSSNHGYWNTPVKVPKRALHTVILKEGLVQELTDDILSFTERKDWYKNMNIPWRRGYLLQGPPGNGKSSLVTAMASEFGFDVRVINLANTGEDDLLSLMSDVPEQSILLFEDIDCAFIERENQKPISMSTMLNVLDGVQATEGRIVVMTTNHPERLDPALIRAGRIDLTLTLDNADEQQVLELAHRFYGDLENFQQAAKKIAKSGYSMADLQGIFLQFAENADAARARLKQIK